jgi:hypothetical protein
VAKTRALLWNFCPPASSPQWRCLLCTITELWRFEHGSAVGRHFRWRLKRSSKARRFGAGFYVLLDGGAYLLHSLRRLVVAVLGSEKFGFRPRPTSHNMKGLDVHDGPYMRPTKKSVSYPLQHRRWRTYF